ncbi:MAG: Gfo/Idh/MocA family oxidoreductase [Deltaproteobacteria bacterium]|nr:Gfo/Idh/MocA family oxidoreductase [Deltaproteobacteria bacterium]
MPTPLRIGVLGAARITPMALLKPARLVPEAAITAVAARDAARARAFATRHGIARVHDSYAALLADPDLDAIYNPLPNGLHAEWTIRALEAGKHVLCEKPLASNAAEAQQMADAAARTGRRLIEAFHWRYHPLATRMRAVIDSGALGPVRHVEATMCIPLPIPGDIRYRYDLAGGATMDVGCYTISVVRFLAGAEPEVLRAEARLSSPNVDRWMTADLRFPDGVSGRITCSLFSATLLKLQAIVRGERGEMRVFNPFAPHFHHRLTLRTGGTTTREHVPGDATYTHQLRAFVAAVRDGTPTPTEPDHGVANMRVIDAVYDRAGLPRRGT